VAGSLLADRAEASPAHRFADREPPMLASLDCKHPGVRPSWHGTLSRLVWRVANVGRQTAQTDAGQIIYRCLLQVLRSNYTCLKMATFLFLITVKK